MSGALSLRASGLVLLAWLTAASAAVAQAPTFIASFGGSGNGPGQFYYPHGLAVDGTGRLYVADTDHDRIEVLNSSDGSFVSEWGSTGTDPGQFNAPWGIAVSAAGTVYVSEFYGNRIQMFTSTGTYLGQWAGVTNPSGVAVDAQGNVYVSHANGVSKYTSAGALSSTWASVPGLGLIYATNGVAASPQGHIFFTHAPSDFAVWDFTASGQYVSRWGVWGTGDGQFRSGPGGLAVDASNNVYVADIYDNRVQVFSPDGQYRSQWGGLGSGAGQFNYPWGVAIDGAGFIYVVDTLNNRVQKVAAAPGATTTSQSTFGALKAKYR